MSSKSITVFVGVAGTLWVLALMTPPVASGQEKSAPPRLKVGQPAPPFTAETTDGKKIALADYRGKKFVLLVFCANFREGSHEAFPILKEIHGKYRTKGIQVIAVPLEDRRDAAAFLGKKFKVAFPTIFDPKFKIAKGYGVDPDGGGPAPNYFLIGRDGKLVISGSRDATGRTVDHEDGLEKAVKELLETK